MQMLPVHQPDAVVIGAGLSGLTAAVTLQKKGYSVHVLEKADRTGGVVRSERIQDFLVELGPNTVQPTPALMKLIDDLDLRDEMQLADEKAPRYVLFQNNLHAVPTSPSAFFSTSLLSVKGRGRLLMEPFIPRHPADREETLGNFARRRLGNEAAERLLAPFVAGVWAGDMEQLSAEAAFPRLANFEREHGSVFLGVLGQKKKPIETSTGVPKGLVSFKEGIATLTQRMADKLEGNMSLRSDVMEIDPPVMANGRWRVRTKAAEFFSRQIFISAPAYEAAALIEPFGLAGAQALRSIPYAPLIVLHLAISKSLVQRSLNGFGYLVPPGQKGFVMGCLWNSSLFPDRAPADQALLTVFLGGARHPNLIRSDNDELLRTAIHEITPVLGLRDEPSLVSLRRYEKAIPQYTLGHRRRIEQLKFMENEFSGLRFVGNYMEGISVGDVIRQAAAAAN